MFRIPNNGKYPFSGAWSASAALGPPAIPAKDVTVGKLAMAGRSSTEAVDGFGANVVCCAFWSSR